MQGILQRARLLALPAVLILVSACASGVTRPSDMESYRPALMGDQKAGKLTVELSPNAQKMAGENLTFDENQLLTILHQTLVAQDALTQRPYGSLPEIEIRVTSVRTRSAVAAIMFGFMAGDDHIKGDVLVRAPDGSELQTFSVNASYAFGGLGGGQDSVRMNWLYENFAKRVAEEVTGIVSDQSPPS